jgi:hypothetical protein
MSRGQGEVAVYTGIRGRDGSTTAPVEIPTTKAVECLNVDFYRTALARKRGGASDAFLDTTSENISTTYAALARHVPGSDEMAAEAWLLTYANPPVLQRLAAGTVWATITVGDAAAFTTDLYQAVFLTFNGKLYVFYNSAVDFLHVYDPDTSTTALRRTGLAAPGAAPTVANTGAGSYAAVLRYYRSRETIRVSSNTVLRSEASSTVSFTPSGTGTAARVTKPADGGQSATHWELEVAVSGSGPWYLLATTVVGTTTYDDSTATTDYGSLTAAPETGDYLRLGSFRYGIADGARLLVGGGSYESGTLDPSSVYYTPVLGTTSSVYYDDERLPSTNRIPLDPKDGGGITGFGGPFEHQVVVFKYRQLWRLIPTGVADDPYRAKAVSKAIGSLHQRLVVMGEDDIGNPTLYWISHLGPYRYNPQYGLVKLTWDVQDLWDRVNLEATSLVGCGVYHADLHQVWWWLALDGANTPTHKLVFDTRIGRVVSSETGTSVRDGWALHTGDSAAVTCAAMLPETFGASMARMLKPYIGQSAAAGRLWRCDTAATTDVGTAFQGLVTFPDRHFGGVDRQCSLHAPLVLGAVGAYSVSVTYSEDYALRTRTGSVSLAASGTETRALRAVEGLAVGDVAHAVGLSVGDASALDTPQWALDAVVVPYEARDTVAG